MPIRVFESRLQELLGLQKIGDIFYARGWKVASALSSPALFADSHSSKAVTVVSWIPCWILVMELEERLNPDSKAQVRELCLKNLEEWQTSIFFNREKTTPHYDASSQGEREFLRSISAKTEKEVLTLHKF